MHQTIHIFRKDARRSSLFIAAVLSLTTLHAVLTPMWTPIGGRFNVMIDLLHVSIPLVWWFTIAHLVHGEPLVGEGQFWVTRPYSWQSLVAAKALFCMVFLLIPFAISDCIILSAADFSPRALWSGLLWRHVTIAEIYLLPAFLIAALTRSTRGFALFCIVLIIAFITLATTIGQLYPHNQMVGSLVAVNPGAWFDKASDLLLWPVGAIALLLWQYATRHTTLVRASAFGLFAIGTIPSFLPPKPITPGAAPAPTKYPEITAGFASERRPTPEGFAGMQDKVQVDLPIQLSGRDRNLLDWNLAAVRITPEIGEPWTSQWNWFIRASDDWVYLVLDPQVFQKLNQGKVRVQAALGIVVYETESVTKLPRAAEWKRIPDFGFVGLWANTSGPVLWWRTPLHLPSQSFSYTIHDPYPSFLRAQWSGPYPPSGEMPFISPVVFQTATFIPGPPERAEGVAGEFVLQRPVALIRRDIEISNIRLADYVVKPQ